MRLLTNPLDGSCGTRYSERLSLDLRCCSPGWKVLYYTPLITRRNILSAASLLTLEGVLVPVEGVSLLLVVEVARGIRDDISANNRMSTIRNGGQCEQGENNRLTLSFHISLSPVREARDHWKVGESEYSSKVNMANDNTRTR